jgi:heme/copper-type cytochrome/quinol oxidase subunit 2
MINILIAIIILPVIAVMYFLLFSYARKVWHEVKPPPTGVQDLSLIHRMTQVEEELAEIKTFLQFKKLNK